MTDGHERYEELAVGHVLGGLDPVDAAEFRTHLVGCRECRLRVAELRDIASDLAAAEREERAAAQVKTEVARRAEGDDAAPSRWAWVPSRGALVGILVGVATLVGLLFWNFALRDTNTRLVDTAETREGILSMLATGTPVEVVANSDVTGVVVRRGGEVALTLGGLPRLRDGESVQVRFLDRDGAVVGVRGPFHNRNLPRGLLALRAAYRTEEATATELVVVVSRGAAERDGADPGGRVLLRADLSPAALRPTPSGDGG